MDMRYKDEAKQSAIIKATVKLVNEIGFVASSISKIAKEADVSPATIYIYYENKEDLLVSTYIDIKEKMGAALLRDFDESLPIRDSMKRAWLNSFDYISKNLGDYRFSEQFANSPYAALVDQEEIDKIFAPLLAVIQRGVEQKILKDVPKDIMLIFCFYPMLLLANTRLCKEYDLNEQDIETAFNMAWDAIKL